jgi:hypothetical protein
MSRSSCDDYYDQKVNAYTSEDLKVISHQVHMSRYTKIMHIYKETKSIKNLPTR